MGICEQAGDVSEFVTYGHQTRRGNTLYLIYRFWPRNATAFVAGVATRCQRSTLLSTGETLCAESRPDGLAIHGLPIEPPCELFPVIRLEFAEPPKLYPWAQDRLWTGDASRMTGWALQRGHSVWTDGKKHVAKPRLVKIEPQCR